jgi:hypothetical protein
MCLGLRGGSPNRDQARAVPLPIHHGHGAVWQSPRGTDVRRREIFVAAAVGAIAAGSGITAVWANLGVMGHGDDAVPTLSVGPLAARRPASSVGAPSGSLAFDLSTGTAVPTAAPVQATSGAPLPVATTRAAGDHTPVDQGLAPPTMTVAAAPDPTTPAAANLPSPPGRDLVGQPSATTTTTPRPHTSTGRHHESPPPPSSSTTTRPPTDGRDD